MMAQPLPRLQVDHDRGPASSGGGPTAAGDDGDRERPDEARNRLALAQQGFLELRLEAAQSRVCALETELAAEKLLLRRVQDDLARTARALSQQSEAGAQAVQERHAVAAQLAGLKQELHEARRARQNLEAQAIRFADVLKAREDEIARLERAAAELQARMQATETRQSALAQAHQKALREMAERLEEQRGEARLLHRALDLARDNRRALHAYIEAMPGRGALEAPAPAGSAPLAFDLAPDQAGAFAPAVPIVLSYHQGAPSVACSQ